MNAKDLRIVFMGTPGFAVASLQKLVDEGYNVVGVVTSPDKPAGRGLQVRESDVKRYAVKAGLPVLQPGKLRDPEFLKQFEALDADLGIVIAFRMLPEVVWAKPRLGTFNLHASLLPQYRGAAPINWAIMNGEKVTGVTTFMLNSEIDKGDILACSRVEIAPEDNAGTLHDKLMRTGSELVVETVEKIASGDADPVAQPSADEELNPAPKIFKEDCLIRWNHTPGQINDFIRGLSPYPAAWSYMMPVASYCVEEAVNEEGEREEHSCAPASPVMELLTVKVFAAKPEFSDHSDMFGNIETDGKKYMKVACKGGWINILELQAAGKKRMSTEEFLRGFKDIGSYSF